jgi:hypothetical protein
VFENRVLRRIFGPERGEVTGGWRKLLNKELRDLYSSPSIIRMAKSRRSGWGNGHCGSHLTLCSVVAVRRLYRGIHCIHLQSSRIAKQEVRTSFPIKRTSFPVKRISFPIKRTSFPVKRISFPVKRISFPVKRMSFPVKSDASHFCS